MEIKLWEFGALISRLADDLDSIAITSGPRSLAAYSRLQSISIAGIKIQPAHSSGKSDFVRIHAAGFIGITFKLFNFDTFFGSTVDIVIYIWKCNHCVCFF